MSPNARVSLFLSELLRLGVSPILLEDALGTVELRQVSLAAESQADRALAGKRVESITEQGRQRHLQAYCQDLATQLLDPP